MSRLKKSIAHFVKLLATYVLPLWILDGCFNREPAFYLDSKSELAATSGAEPLYFQYRDRARPYFEGYHLDSITDFLMDKSVFTGMTGSQYFIVRRADGYKMLFDTKTERDAVLAQDYSTNTSKLHEKPWYSGIRANGFFPYNLIYYFSATVISALYCFTRRNRGAKPTALPPVEKADGSEEGS